MTFRLPEGGGGRTPEPPGPKPPAAPSNTSLIGANPGLITSTGGLVGTSGLMLTPAFNQITNSNFLITHNSSNFNCEEDAEYDFRQEANYGQIPGEGRQATFHLIILKYRELGEASFNINITVFVQDIDDFKTIQIPVKIQKKKRNNFPDGRIHTRRLQPPKSVVQGERPQVTITRLAGSGPLSITKLILCGNADELAQQ